MLILHFSFLHFPVFKFCRHGHFTKKVPLVFFVKCYAAGYIELNYLNFGFFRNGPQNITTLSLKFVGAVILQRKFLPFSLKKLTPQSLSAIFTLFFHYLGLDPKTPCSRTQKTSVSRYHKESTTPFFYEIIYRSLFRLSFIVFQILLTTANVNDVFKAFKNFIS